MDFLGDPNDHEEVVNMCPVYISGPCFGDSSPPEPSSSPAPQAPAGPEAGMPSSRGVSQGSVDKLKIREDTNQLISFDDPVTDDNFDSSPIEGGGATQEDLLDFAPGLSGADGIAANSFPAAHRVYEDLLDLDFGVASSSPQEVDEQSSGGRLYEDLVDIAFDEVPAQSTFGQGKVDLEYEEGPDSSATDTRYDANTGHCNSLFGAYDHPEARSHQQAPDVDGDEGISSSHGQWVVNENWRDTVSNIPSSSPPPIFSSSPLPSSQTSLGDYDVRSECQEARESSLQMHFAPMNEMMMQVDEDDEDEDELVDELAEEEGGDEERDMEEEDQLDSSPADDMPYHVVHAHEEDQLDCSPPGDMPMAQHPDNVHEEPGARAEGDNTGSQDQAAFHFAMHSDVDVKVELEVEEEPRDGHGDAVLPSRASPRPASEREGSEEPIAQVAARYGHIFEEPAFHGEIDEEQHADVDSNKDSTFSSSSPPDHTQSSPSRAIHDSHSDAAPEAARPLNTSSPADGDSGAEPSHSAPDPERDDSRRIEQRRFHAAATTAVDLTAQCEKRGAAGDMKSPALTGRLKFGFRTAVSLESKGGEEDVDQLERAQENKGEREDKFDEFGGCGVLSGNGDAKEENVLERGVDPQLNEDGGNLELKSLDDNHVAVDGDLEFGRYSSPESYYDGGEDNVPIPSWSLRKSQGEFEISAKKVNHAPTKALGGDGDVIDGELDLNLSSRNGKDPLRLQVKGTGDKGAHGAATVIDFGVGDGANPHSPSHSHEDGRAKKSGDQTRVQRRPSAGFPWKRDEPRSKVGPNSENGKEKDMEEVVPGHEVGTAARKAPPPPSPEATLPAAPNPKRPTLAGQQYQHKKLSKPFRCPTVISKPIAKATGASASSPSTTSTSSSSHVAIPDSVNPLRTGKPQSAIESGRMQQELEAGAPKQKEDTKIRHRTQRASAQFKSPLTTISSIGEQALNSIKPTPSIQALEIKAQTLKRALRVVRDKEEETLQRLIAKWLEGGREVAYELWTLCKDAAAAEDSSASSGRSGWGMDSAGGSPKRKFGEGWGWDAGNERKKVMSERGSGSSSNWGWEDPAVPVTEDDEQGGRAEHAEYDALEENDEGSDNGETKTHETIGTMLMRLGICPATLGWDEEEGCFVD